MAQASSSSGSLRPAWTLSQYFFLYTGLDLFIIIIGIRVVHHNYPESEWIYSPMMLHFDEFLWHFDEFCGILMKFVQFDEFCENQPSGSNPTNQMATAILAQAQRGETC